LRLACHGVYIRYSTNITYLYIEIPAIKWPQLKLSSPFTLLLHPPPEGQGKSKAAEILHVTPANRQWTNLVLLRILGTDIIRIRLLVKRLFFSTLGQSGYEYAEENFLAFCVTNCLEYLLLQKRGTNGNTHFHH